jgi:hypothetical protein
MKCDRRDNRGESAEDFQARFLLGTSSWTV